MTSNTLTRSVVIMSFAFGGLVACNSGDYKTSDDNTVKDSVSTGAADKMSSDSAATAAAKASAAAKRRGKMTIKMPASASTDKMVKDNEGVYNWAQTSPEFPGGQNALDNYVNNNIEYPQQAIDDNASGTVRVSFIVDENGKVMKPHIIGNKIGNGLDEQALKVVSNMPAWQPGKVKGKNVKTRLELPIAFQVEG